MEVVHVFKKLSMLEMVIVSQSPNNVRVLLWICFSLAPPDPVSCLRLPVIGYPAGDRHREEDNGLPKKCSVALGF